MRRHTLRLICLLPLSLLVLSSCESPDIAAKLEARRASIAAEPPGDYYIGRRFHIDRTHFWGYVRRPREGWENAKLVVMNEKLKPTPDRMPEAPMDGGPAFGHDHNHEYRLKGYYSGRRIYDPNSDLKIVEFVLQDWQLINSNPGWLFKPNERFNGSTLLRAEPDSVIVR
ncbi:MAG: hypothetical protein K1X78_15770 [Verrucomicrobiaceae bacterium]|nr:hypothetical protein [Verrucomicrobiaceae bacterium]